MVQRILLLIYIQARFIIDELINMKADLGISSWTDLKRILAELIYIKADQ